MEMNEYLESIDTLARTVWGEARGEGSAGMRAVAAVILNRLAVAQAQGGYWWGATIIDICRKPYQFSCWNARDPNRERLLRVTKDDPAFRAALGIAESALSGLLADHTSGATHYHAAGVSPVWAKRSRPVAVIGRHIFYRLE